MSHRMERGPAKVKWALNNDDYQGSLTSLLLPPAELRVAAAEQRLAHDFFAAGAERRDLRHYTCGLPDHGEI